MASSRDLEFSLSEALIDPDFTEQSRFPSLVDHEPYERAQEPMLLFKPPLKKQPMQNKKARKMSADMTKKKSEGGGGIIAEFFGNKKRRASQPSHTKQGTLHRSRSFDTLHRRIKGWDNVIIHEEDEVKQKDPTTFVYKPFKRTDKQSPSSDEEEEEEEKQTEQANTVPDSEGTNLLIRPKRDSQIFSERGMSIYEEPISLLQGAGGPLKDYDQTTSNTTEEVDNSPMPPSTNVNAESPRAPQKPARRRPRSSPTPIKKMTSFTDQDIMIPPTSSSTYDNKKTPPHSPEAANTSSTGSVNEDMSLIRIRVLGVQMSQKHKESVKPPSLDSDEEEDDEDHNDNDDGERRLEEGSALPPTDGIFCTLTINGKQSRFESSIQPLKPREQVAVWDHNETEAVFYGTQHQKLFIASRKLPLKEHKSNQSIALSLNAKSECFGVGIYPLANLTPDIVTQDNDIISNWTDPLGTSHEINVELDPLGSVLLQVSRISMNPSSKVTCSGTVTIKYLNGIDTFRDESPCWTCCTVDIDDVNYGTTASIIGMEEFLDKGYSQDVIEFTADKSTACKIQIWGFGDDETEYWFGEAYVPLAAILPYSKHLVHQEDEQKPLMLLGEAEQEITLPIEPAGTIGLLFNLSPAPEPDPIEEETIKQLEASGVFTPAAIAHFRQHSSTFNDGSSSKTDDQKPLNSITPIPEESLSSQDDSTHTSGDPMSKSILSRKPSNKRFIPSRLSLKKRAQDWDVSGNYDHLTPSPTAISLPPSNPILHSITQSLKDKKQTLRLLGSIKLQVPTDYQEKKFRMLPEDFDPYREIEIMKVEMRDLKAKLAETQFLREKAELKVKNLETEIDNYKSKKKRGRKYY